MKLLERIKTLKKTSDENTISSDYFYVGSEGFVFKNVYIPLEAVSIVKLLRIEDIPLIPYLKMIGAGILLSVVGTVLPHALLILAGILVLIIGGIRCFQAWIENQKKVYRILLKLNNGECYTLTYGNLESTNNVVDKIRTCIMKRSKAPSYYINNGNIELIREKSVGKVCDNIFNGNVGNIAAGENIHINSAQGNLTEEDWNTLQTFLEARIENFDTDSESYGDCRILLEYTERKQEARMKDLIKKLIQEKKLRSIFVSGVDSDTLGKIREIIKKL